MNIAIAGSAVGLMIVALFTNKDFNTSWLLGLICLAICLQNDKMEK